MIGNTIEMEDITATVDEIAQIIAVEREAEVERRERVEAEVGEDIVSFKEPGKVQRSRRERSHPIGELASPIDAKEVRSAFDIKLEGLRVESL